MIKTCINCGEPSTQFLCTPCIEAGDELAKLLKQGIELEYSDGTKKTLTPEGIK